MFKDQSKKTKLAIVAGAVILVAALVLAWTQRTPKEPISTGQPASQALNGEIESQSFVAERTPTPQTEDKVFGSAEAPLKIFVFEDYASPFSAMLADNLEKIMAEFGSSLTVIVRPYVDNSALALQAAAAVDCAGEQGKWKEMRALLFAKVKSKQVLEPASPDYSSQLDLDGNRLEICLTNARKSGKIEQATAAAQEYQVYGAPTIFIGEEMIPGARPYEDYIDSDGKPVAGLKTIVASKIR